MPSQILFNNEIYHQDEAELPCLITYQPKSGGSHFSITMVVDLFLQGMKILFLTAYPMAKDNFLEQVSGHEEKVIYITDENQLDTNAQAIILASGNEELCLKVLEKITDLSDRVVLIKNIEVFSEKLIKACLNLDKVILSGDIDKCVLKQEIINKSYKTIVAFSKPEVSLPFELPVLEKYFGYLWNNKNKGLVSVKM
jgi:hypothetical protein